MKNLASSACPIANFRLPYPLTPPTPLCARTHAYTMQKSLEYCEIGPGRFQDQESLTKCKNDLMNVRDTETYEVVSAYGLACMHFPDCL